MTADADALIARLKQRVADEPLDERLGQAGVDEEGVGEFRQIGGVLRRIYPKHTADYARAHARGWLLPAPPAPPPASAAALRATEAACGIALPPLLARLYREVANGGFGPAYGLLGVVDGHRDDVGRTAWRWADNRGPAVLIAICHWGCGIYSLVDAADPDARMWGYDPNADVADADAVFPQELGLAQWLERWLDGRLHQPWLIEDPVTGRWRGATDDEHAAALATER